MHPTVSHELARARTADLRHRAQHDALARAARRAAGPKGDSADTSRPWLAAVVARWLGPVPRSFDGARHAS